MEASSNFVTRTAYTILRATPHFTNLEANDQGMAMTNPRRILLKTTIPTIADDWHIGRFAMLASHLASLTDAGGAPLYKVTARDRIEDAAGNDPDFAAGEFDQLWIFAVDVTNAITEVDAAHINAARARGAGLFITRDHQDLGACLLRLGAIGATQHFQSGNPDPDDSRHCCDDLDTPDISWPNYHSGANGDLQRIEAVVPVHPVVAGVVTLPAHPHEGSVGVPPCLDGAARVIARGHSRISGTAFNLAVAIEEPGQGRVLSDSSFHHLCDYNWDPRAGCPSFVTEHPGDGILRDTRGLADAHRYVENAAGWLARRI